MTRRDPVTEEVRWAVLARDRMCVAYRFDQSHVCRDVFGNVHPPFAVSRMTLDHVHRHAGGTKGKRAPSDPQHLVTLCGHANVSVPSRGLRELERQYLDALYPEEDVA